jgi:drug/metabolite transporter (DMT)-like permease
MSKSDSTVVRPIEHGSHRGTTVLIWVVGIAAVVISLVIVLGNQGGGGRDPLSICLPRPRELSDVCRSALWQVVGGVLATVIPTIMVAVTASLDRPKKWIVRCVALLPVAVALWAAWSPGESLEDNIVTMVISSGLFLYLILSASSFMGIDMDDNRQSRVRPRPR